MTGSVERHRERAAEAAPRGRSRPPGPRLPGARSWIVEIVGLLLLCVFAGFGAGCVGTAPKANLHPTQTEIPSKGTSAPAQLIGNTLIVEARAGDGSLCHFLIDTGSSVTLVSPDFAGREALPPDEEPASPEVTDQSADGAAAVLLTTTIRRIQIGSARFDSVPALVYDCGDLSAQFGVPIDGILGFPLFQKAILTLDYPQGRILLRPTPGDPADVRPLGGVEIPLKLRNRTPVVTVHLGGERFDALLDSGSDLPLSLNPMDLRTDYAYGPVEGGTVGTLAGDRVLRVGRLAGDLYIAGFAVPRPIADTSNRLSALGGGILKQFVVTFDQAHGRVSFSRDSTDPVAIPPVRTTGLSFQKTPAYWKVVGVIPHSPADGSDIDQGDLVAKINGEPVGNWSANRYRKLEENADSIEYTTIDGTRETRHDVKVIDLVP